MQKGDILDCIVIRRDESGAMWVRNGETLGIVDNFQIAWNSEDIPAVGDRINVFVEFPTPYPEVDYDFVGSIKEAYPEKHPIRFMNDSMIGSRFVSQVIPMGKWWGLRHPSGVPALLSREALDRAALGDREEIEVEIAEIDRQKEWLKVRLPRDSAGSGRPPEDEVP
jgi:hypothetical protein